VTVIQPPQASRHVAQQGDNLSTIAARYGTFLGVFSLAVLAAPAARAQAAPDAATAGAFTPSSLAAAARLGPDQLRVAFRSEVARPADYVVRPGDTLSGISAKLFGNPDKWPWLYDYNRKAIGANPDMITPGEKLSPVLGSKPEYGDAVAAVARAQQVVADYRTAAVTARPGADDIVAAGSGFQGCVIARESGGNSQVMNSSAHYGLYQFSESTWEEYGGSAADFGHASVAEQNQVFGNAMARGGESNWSPYDGC
jgi:Transglycosylase-like domain/LysM domain